MTLSYLVANLKPGSAAKLDFIRDKKTMSATATVGTRPSEETLAGFNSQGEDGLGGDDDDDTPGATQPAANALGFSVLAMTPAIARDLGVEADTPGVVVDRVDPSSDAATKLKRGDIISAIDGVNVTSAQMLAAAVANAKRENRNVVLVFRQRGRTPGGFVPLKLKN